MHFEPKSTVIAATLVYVAAAVFGLVSLWFFLSGAFALDLANRSRGGSVC